MSGHFEKGAWVEKREDIPDPVWDRDLKRMQIRDSRDMLDKAIDDALIGEHKRLMDLEIKVQRAGFRQRLWYLLTGKL
jgi:hypothetical protein